jgi:FkbM family methyltransferase
MNLRRVEWIHCHTVHLGYLQAGSIVIDVGANVGGFSRRITAVTGCSSYALEPLAGAFDRIPEGERIRKFNIAAANQNGPVNFNVSSDPLGSTMLDVISSDNLGSVTVRATTIESFVHAHGISRVDLIKMDIEGAEVSVLDSCSDEFLSGVTQLTVEFHDFNGQVPRSEVQRIVGRLKRLGFFYVRMSGIGNQDAWFINRALCGISMLECLYIRYVVRNVVGLTRIVRRRLGLAWAR